MSHERQNLNRQGFAVPQRPFDVLVIGAGHAGCEAALAAARLGARVGLVTLRTDRIAQMSCNPAVGGVGKGHLVREIDALGGAMAEIADRTGIQFRRLNASRGPAVRSTRCQSDSDRYRAAMTDKVGDTPNLEILEDEAVDLDLAATRQGGRELRGVVLARRGTIPCRAVIITTGTFLNGLCHVGDEQFAGGRVGDAPALRLSSALRRTGLELGRFKTGTTPRLHRDSIAWHRLEEQAGDIPAPRFSFDDVRPELPQVSCYITATTDVTHGIVRDNLHRSPLYQGIIKGRGPRYCPSFEDKVVRFADKERHQIFLEPEGIDSERVYPNGLSTSLPKDAQEAFIKSIPGLEDARIIQHGYAVEYDYSPPTQLHASLMTKCCTGLFLAGQINGTSGYEEAAAQGLMAGLNAVAWLGNREPLILGRHEAYIGVMIDDLVTKGVDEPYRVFTSRAEHRLTLRESNAEERLWRKAAAWGLLTADRQSRALSRENERLALRQFLETTRVGVELAANLGLDSAGRDVHLSRAELLRRPGVEVGKVAGEGFSTDTQVLVEETIKYAGYIEREAREIARSSELEEVRIPESVDYRDAPGLSRELQIKLAAVRPNTLGQASRIPGMTPAALALLRVQAHRWRGTPS